MSVSVLPTNVARVDDQTGEQVSRRREAIGIGRAALARRAGVDRGRLKVLEEGGNVRMTTVSAVLHALDELEHEMGMDLPSVVEGPAAATPNVMRVEVQGVYGAKALVFEAPVDNIAELEEMVDRVMRRLAGENDRAAE